MRNDELINRRRNLANHFENVFERLLSGETLDLYAERVSFMFEVIAANLLAELPERKGVYFDGVVPLSSAVRKSRQVVFTGKMWIGEDDRQWQEDFRATVTDKRITKQGVWITLCIGSDKAEGKLSAAFGFTE